MTYFPSWREDQYPAEDQLICQTIYLPIGDEYRAQLAGALSLLADVNSYQDSASAQAEGIAAVWDTANSQIVWEEWLMSDWRTVASRTWTEQMEVVSGAATVWLDVAGQAYSGIYRQTPAAQFDALNAYVALKAGDYEVRVLGTRNTNRGIQSVVVDSFIVATFDWYGAAVALNVLQSDTFTVDFDGVYLVESLMASRHASSTGYALQMNYIDFIRTP